MAIKPKLQSLLASANDVTGEERTNLTDAVQDLVDGYGQGGDDGWESIDVDVVSSPVSFGVRYNDYSNLTIGISETTDTSLTKSIACQVGDLVVVCFVVRDSSTNITVSSGWTFVSLSNAIDSNQRMGWAYKIATSSTESITITQPSSQRLYINMIAITLDDTSSLQITDGGYSYQTYNNSLSGQKTSKNAIWGCTTPYSSGYAWIVSKECCQTNNVRLLTCVDSEDITNITIQKNDSNNNMILGHLEITGVSSLYEEVEL